MMELCVSVIFFVDVRGRGEIEEKRVEGKEGKKKRRWGVDKDESLENLGKEQKSKGARGAQKTQEAKKKKTIAPFGLVILHVTLIVT